MTKTIFLSTGATRRVQDQAQRGGGDDGGRHHEPGGQTVGRQVDPRNSNSNSRVRREVRIDEFASERADSRRLRLGRIVSDSTGSAYEVIRQSCPVLYCQIFFFV